MNKNISIVITCWLFTCSSGFAQEESCSKLASEFSNSPGTMSATSLVLLSSCINSELATRFSAVSQSVTNDNVPAAQLIGVASIGEISSDGCGGVDPLLECIEIDGPDGVDPLLVPGIDEPWLYGEFHTKNKVWVVNENSSATMLTVEKFPLVGQIATPILEAINLDKVYEIPFNGDAMKLYMSGEALISNN